MSIFDKASLYGGTVIQARALVATAAMADIPDKELRAESVVEAFVATQAIFDWLRDGGISHEAIRALAQGLRRAERLGLSLPVEKDASIEELVPVAKTAIYRKGGSKRQRGERRAKMLQMTGFPEMLVQARRRMHRVPGCEQSDFWSARCDMLYVQLRALEEAQGWYRDAMPFPLPRHYGLSEIGQ